MAQHDNKQKAKTDGLKEPQKKPATPDPQSAKQNPVPTQTPPPQDFNYLVKERLRKLDELRQMGVDPYPYSFPKTHDAKAILDEFQSLKPEEKTQERVVVAGRIMTLRRMGKASFMHIQDQTGKIQLFLREDDLGADSYKIVKLLDLGDIVGSSGFVFRTKAGEITVNSQAFQILSKAIRPMPEKYHGLQDTEIRYRKRYLDLFMNPEVKETFIKRTRIIDTVREELNNRSFIEMETPVLNSNYGGANARPFKSHLNALNMPIYLRISDELHLKRLLVGGFERVYEFCKDFRNEGVDRTHNPEFMMVEAYQAWVDFTAMMNLIEDIYVAASTKVNGTTKVQFGEHTIDFKKPWKRMSMVQAIKDYGKIDVEKLSDEELFDLRITYNLKIEGDLTRSLLITGLFEELVEPKLVQPHIITEHPIETTPLCKPSRNDKRFVERFEAFAAGFELCNAYSELNDPVLQRKLLEEQAAKLRAGSQEAHPMDEDFCEAIETGMPPAGGIGFGIDRMVMLLTNSHSIRDVLLFPFMKDEEK
ncbi:MAG: lysine--tRNA ligase [Nanoarchaeota archaeon]